MHQAVDSEQLRAHVHYEGQLEHGTGHEDEPDQRRATREQRACRRQGAQHLHRAPKVDCASKCSARTAAPRGQSSSPCHCWLIGLSAGREQGSSRRDGARGSDGSGSRRSHPLTASCVVPSTPEGAKVLGRRSIAEFRRGPPRAHAPPARPWPRPAFSRFCTAVERARGGCPSVRRSESKGVDAPAAAAAAGGTTSTNLSCAGTEPRDCLYCVLSCACAC